MVPTPEPVLVVLGRGTDKPEPAPAGCVAPAMDLASLGRPEERLMQPMRPLFRLPAARQVDAARGLARRLALAANATAQRAFAASAQAVLAERVTRFLDRVLPATQRPAPALPHARGGEHKFACLFCVCCIVSFESPCWH